MGKIIVSAWITLDGLVAGPADEMDWLSVDEEMMRYELDLVEHAHALLLGRITHADFAAAWPAAAEDPSESELTRAYARRVCALPKVAASARGDLAEWQPTTRLPTVDRESIDALKRTYDGDIVVYGSLRVVDALTTLEAVDEFHLLVHPLLLGRGKPLYPRRPQLRHLSATTVAGGVVLNRYAPA